MKRHPQNIPVSVQGLTEHMTNATRWQFNVQKFKLHKQWAQRHQPDTMMIWSHCSPTCQLTEEFSTIPNGTYIKTYLFWHLGQFIVDGRRSDITSHSIVNMEIIRKALDSPKIAIAETCCLSKFRKVFVIFLIPFVSILFAAAKSAFFVSSNCNLSAEHRLTATFCGVLGMLVPAHRLDAFNRNFATHIDMTFEYIQCPLSIESHLDFVCTHRIRSVCPRGAKK